MKRWAESECAVQQSCKMHLCWEGKLVTRLPQAQLAAELGSLAALHMGGQG